MPHLRVQKHEGAVSTNDMTMLANSTNTEEFPELKQIEKKTSSNSLPSAWGSKKSFADLLKCSNSGIEEIKKPVEEISSTIEIINDIKNEKLEKVFENNETVDDWIIDDNA